MSEASNQEEEDEAVIVPPAAHTLLVPSSPPTVIEEMDEMFLRLGFSQAIMLKLVDDKGIDSLWTLTRLFDEDIGTICGVIYRSSRLMSGKTQDRGDQISVLAAKISNS